MPSEDVSDLRDVVDAINKLCDTMKTSSYDEETFEDCSQNESVDLPLFIANEETVSEEAIVAEVESDPDWYVASQIETVSPEEVIFKKVEHYNTETWRQSVSRLEIASPEDKVVHKVETYNAVERWSDSSVSLPGQAEDVETIASDEPAQAQCEPFSEVYYTASSEVSLLSDLEPAEKGQEEEPVAEKEDDRKECVIAGHVAAMRERFESMTRTNTPCPDLIRSSSPSLDVFRNITPSPDRLG
ncbi:uncharacterized protein [Choristoneura fumiferana]|uniref:uncharacterized protein n=1 Tax=Choristoneura fumiferana TaxID=7141 RepID=UPI003D1545FB